MPLGSGAREWEEIYTNIKIDRGHSALQVRVCALCCHY